MNNLGKKLELLAQEKARIENKMVEIAGDKKEKIKKSLKNFIKGK
jgi:hypothetical protein